MTPEPVGLEEDQIDRKFGKSFDKQVILDGYKNGNEFPHPSRYLHEWYLTTTSEPHRRQPLPDDCKFDQEHVLHGFLVDDGSGERALVRITDLQTWLIDRSDSSRGIWVESSSANYCLKEPCTKKVGIDVKLSPTNHHQTELSPLEASLPSQAEVHLPMRAKFGLVSNLCDIFAEAFKDVPSNYAPIHSKRTAKQVHELLSPSEEALQDYNSTKRGCDAPLHTEPFDLRLLQKHPSFVKVHMLNFHTLLDESSLFIKSLEELGPSSEELTSNEYLESATAAEKRSQRTPWGDVLPDGKLPVRPNLLIQLEIQKASADQSSSNGMQESSDDDEENVVKPRRRSITGPPSQPPTDLQDTSDEDDDIVAPSRRRSRLVTRKSSVDDEEEEEKTEPLLDQKPPYSEENMAEALKDFGPYMDPPPKLDESGKWEDVEARKFSFDASKGADVLKILQRPELPTLEFMLLFLSCLRQSCKQKHAKVLKKLFSNPSKESGAKFIGAKIFGDTWRSHALELLETRHKESGGIEAGKTAEELVLTNIIMFIPECYIIKSGKQLETLKSVRNLDWNASVEDTMGKANKMQNRDMIKACFSAQAHLKKLQLADVKDGAAETAKKSGGSAEAAEAMVKAEKAKEAAAAATELLRKESAPLQKKGEENKGRSLRLQRMLKKAQATAGLAASSNADSAAVASPSLKTTGLDSAPTDPRFKSSSSSFPDQSPSTHLLTSPDQSRQQSSTAGWGPAISATKRTSEPSSSGVVGKPSGWGSWKPEPGATWGSKYVNKPEPTSNKAPPPSGWINPVKQTLTSDVTRDASAATAGRSSDSLPGSIAPARNDNQLGVQSLKRPASASRRTEEAEIPAGRNSRYPDSGQSTERLGSGSAAIGVAQSASHQPRASAVSEADRPRRPSQPGRSGYQGSASRETDRRDSYSQNHERNQEGKSRGYERDRRPSDSYNRADSSSGYQADPYARRDSDQRGSNRDSYAQPSRRLSREGDERNSRRGSRFEDTGGKRREPELRYREEPPNKRTRSDTSDPSARAAPPLANAAVAQGSAGLGRGRGRGRTLPAWMTQQQDGLGGTPSSSTGGTGGIRAEVPAAAVPAAANSGLPPARQPSPPVNPLWNSNASFPTDCVTRNHKHPGGGPSRRGVADPSATGAGGGAGRGRGRGKDVNKPAWMTHGMM